MTSKDIAFDDFVDDCFLDNDPLCNKRVEESLELVASQIIAELVEDDRDNSIAA